MKNAFHIAAREVFSFFVTPFAWVLLTVWMVVEGLHFYLLATYYASQSFAVGDVSDTPVTYFFSGLLFFLPVLVAVPLLTMRLVAEERRTGTMETLLTAPVRDAEVVFGKYLAAWVFWLALWAPTALYLPLLSAYGDLDWGAVGAAYIGVACLGAYYLALGVLMSTLSGQMAVAGSLTFAALVLLLLLGLGEYVFLGDAADVLAYVNAIGHMESFAKGVVDTRHLVFSLSTSALALFLAVRALEIRRVEG